VVEYLVLEQPGGLVGVVGYFVLEQPGGLVEVGGTVGLVVGMGGCKAVEQTGMNNSQGTSVLLGMEDTDANVGCKSDG